MTQKIIEFKQFSFKYKAQQEPSLQNINLTIYQGEKVLIIGPSGSGKSTLGHCLNGIIPNIHKGEMTGNFLLRGEDAFHQSVYDKSNHVSTVLQDTDGQFIGLSVTEDLAFALENDCIPLKQMQQQVTTWAHKLDLTDFLNHRPQDLSGGQKQRVSLAGVLIDESPILLFDEPLANLDPKSGQETIALIDHIHHQEKTTTLIIEHRLEDVLYRSVDRVVLLNEGRIVFNGHPNQLLATDHLEENGIREPLYLTALKQFGFQSSEDVPLANLEKLDLSQLKIQIPKQTFSEKHNKELLFEVKHLNFSYPSKKGLREVGFQVKKGDKIAILGKNGAGKSTLAKALCQLVKPEGDFFWKGQLANGDSIKERAEKIGYVLQNPNHMISQTLIFDEIALGLRLRKVPEEQIQDRVFAVLKICGLYSFRNWPISALSFGQKKRVTIASILVLNPEVILLDEPTAGQDQRNYTDIMTFLDDLNNQGHTIIMITHDMALMTEYSTRALVVDDGRIIADNHPDAILSNPELVNKANLKTTSLFELANRLNQDPLDLTAYYYKKRGVSHV